MNILIRSSVYLTFYRSHSHVLQRYKWTILSSKPVSYAHGNTGKIYFLVLGTQYNDKHAQEYSSHK